jgi:L-ascorbate metabolism protein UlaG (beta-lactamase superfamily)
MMQIPFTYYGHGCFAVSTKGLNLVFDPFITGNPLVQGKIDVGTIHADYILLTHGHSDHTADVMTIAQRTGATVIANYEIAVYYQEKGLKAHPMNLGGKFQFPFGILKMVNAVHSSVLGDGTYAGNPGGFVLWNEETCFYAAGDTALTLDMQLIPKTCPALEFCILPIGDNFTMGYEDAVLAADFVACSRVIGVHYDTFGYIVIDQEAAKKAFEGAGKSLILPAIGATIQL